MVAPFTMRTYGVNLEFRLDEGIWLHRKSGKIRFYFRKIPFLHHACATCSEQPSYIKTMDPGVFDGRIWIRGCLDGRICMRFFS